MATSSTFIRWGRCVDWCWKEGGMNFTVSEIMVPRTLQSRYCALRSEGWLGDWSALFRVSCVRRQCVSSAEMYLFEKWQQSLVACHLVYWLIQVCVWLPAKQKSCCTVTIYPVYASLNDIGISFSASSLVTRDSRRIACSRWSDSWTRLSNAKFRLCSWRDDSFISRHGNVEEHWLGREQQQQQPPPPPHLIAVIEHSLAPGKMHWAFLHSQC